MKYPQVVEVLLDLERHIDVNACWMDGIQIWPLLRRDLWMRLLTYDDAPESMSTTVPPGVNGAARQSVSQGRTGRRRTTWPRVSARQARLADRVGSELFDGLGRADVLFLSRPQDHTETFAAGTIDRVVDPMMWLVRDSGLTACKVTVGKDTQWQGQRQVEESVMLPIDRLRDLEQTETAPKGPIERHLARRRCRRQQRERDALEALMATVAARLGGDVIPTSQIVSAVRRLDGHARLFDQLLRKVKPRLVMLGVFYSPEAMALTHACRHRGIPVVEIQHGKQGLFHGMYSHWSALPRDGYSVMPDIFWNWGGESAETIRGSLPEGTGRPLTVVGGNRWLASWKEQAGLPGTPETDALLRRMAGFRKTILLGLQPLPNPIPPHLMAVMKLTPSDWLWLVRLHPHHRSQAGALEAQMKEEGIKSFDVTAASNVPLYPLLSRVDAQITCWSSVAYEALAFGKPALLVHPIAKSLYDLYIEQGLFIYADTAEDLMAALESAMETGPVTEPVPYIETSTERAREALDFCLNFKPAETSR